MKVIPISGVIGWDISPKDLRASLDSAGGEEVEIQISSPGGVAVNAFEMYNLIRNYKGVKGVRLMGMAASAASYIAMAADKGKLRGESNVVFMIHNTQGAALGDHNTMRKTADILDGLSRVVAQAYAARSGKSIKEIRATMDAEGWYFGAEAKDAGFVDEIVPALDSGEKDKETAMAVARAKLQSCRRIISEVEDAEMLEEAVALAPALIEEKPAGVAGEQTAAKADGTLKTGGAKTMTLEELKRDHPALYAEATKAEREAGKVEGVALGVTQERARVSALEKWIAADEGNEKVAQIVAEAKTTGKAEADVIAQLQVAVRDGVKAQADPDNPPSVRTQGAAPSGPAMTPEVKAEVDRMAPKMGVTQADIAKFGGDQKGGR